MVQVLPEQVLAAAKQRLLMPSKCGQQ
jgi:hypothetical protein